MARKQRKATSSMQNQTAIPDLATSGGDGWLARLWRAGRRWIADLAAPQSGLPDDPAARSLWARSAQAFALIAVFLAVVLYPLQIRVLDASLKSFFSVFPDSMENALFAYCRFWFTPLALKESFVSIAMLLSIACWATWRLTATIERKPLRTETVLFVLFIAWVLVSVLWAPGFPSDSHAFFTVYNFAIWSLFAIALFDLTRTAWFRRVAGYGIMALGLLLMLISAAQATPPFSKWIFTVMTEYAGPHQRNLYGSLIAHNTGVAGICMGPFFFFLGGFMAARKWGVRVFLGCVVLLAFYFFLKTKSRFVWLALIVLIPVFLLGLRYAIDSPIRLRHFGYGALALLVLIGIELAPIGGERRKAERDNYIVRFLSLRPSVLVQGTRWRILNLSVELIAERPLVGHGLGSFAALYPKVQADYFAVHPFSELRPPTALSQHAHNDYLQLLIETGLIGLGLALATLVLFVRRGLRGLRRVECREERLRRYCGLFGMVSLLLHAFVDFPFHIAPIATFFLFYCALFYGSSSEDESEPVEATARTPRDETAWSLRPRKVAQLTVIPILWALPLPATYFMAVRLKSDTYFAQASSHLVGAGDETYAKTATDQFGFLELARKEFSQSLHYDPFQFQARLQKAQCEYDMARLTYAEYKKAREEKNETKARELRTQLQTLLDSAEKEAVRATWSARDTRADNAAPSEDPVPDGPCGPLGPRVNHILFYCLAQICTLQQELDPQDMALRRRALFYAEEAVRYCPIAAQYTFTLLNRLNPKIPAEKEKRQHYIGQIAHYNPELFLERFLEQAAWLVQEERLDQAQDLLDEMIASVRDPFEFPQIYEALANMRLLRGDMGAFGETLATIRAHFPESLELTRLEFIALARAGKVGEALAYLEPLIAEGRLTGERWQFAYAEALIQAGREAEGRAVSIRTLRASSHPSQSYAVRGAVRRHCFGNLSGAVEDYDTASQFYPWYLPQEAALDLLRARAEAGDRQTVDRVLGLVNDAYKDSYAFKRARAKLIESRDAASDEKPKP